MSTKENRPSATAVAKTGFWGHAGAGCLFLARDTGRLLIAHRSRHVNEPNTWGTFGGAVDDDLLPIEYLRKEVHQKCGFVGPIHVSAMLVLVTDPESPYFNYLVTVDNEFDPRLDSEKQGYLWVEFGDWPIPMHSGLKAVLADPSSIKMMRRSVAACKERTGLGMISGKSTYEVEGAPFIIRRVIGGSSTMKQASVPSCVQVWEIEGPAGKLATKFQSEESAVAYLTGGDLSSVVRVEEPALTLAPANTRTPAQTSTPQPSLLI